MAQGTGKVFDALVNYSRENLVDYESAGWAMILCSDPITALLVGETNPARGSTNITEVSAGGGYSTGGIALTLDNTETGGVLTMKLNTSTHSSGILAWSKAASSPTDIKTAVLIDKNSISPGPTDAAVKFWDLPEDGGTTPHSLVAVDINLTCGLGGVVGELLTIQTVN